MILADKIKSIPYGAQLGPSPSWRGSAERSYCSWRWGRPKTEEHMRWGRCGVSRGCCTAAMWLCSAASCWEVTANSHLKKKTYICAEYYMPLTDVRWCARLRGRWTGRSVPAGEEGSWTWRGKSKQKGEGREPGRLEKGTAVGWSGAHPGTAEGESVRGRHYKAEWWCHWGGWWRKGWQ